MAQTLANLLVRIGADASGLDKELSKIERKMNQFGNRLQDVGRKLTTTLTVPLALVGGAAVKTASDWESAFAGVVKTVDATAAELDELAAGIRQMALDTPHSAVQLANLAEAAGQLGIQTDAILDFTKVVADLGVATANLSGDEAAQSMARFANIMQMPQDQFDRLGSTIVHLGNNLATTEGEIMEFGLRIAGAGKIAGLTEAQVLAIGGAMSSVGVQAEAGGTAIQKVLMTITNSVAQGDDKLKMFAATAGMTAQEFAERWQSDAAGAFTSFVEGLGRAGDDAFVVLRELGLQDQRLMRSFLSLANAGDLLRESIDLGTEAWRDNTALTREAQIRYETFQSKLANFRNQLQEVGITLGEALLPAAKAALEAAQPMIEALGRIAERFAAMSPQAQEAWLKIGLFIAALGPGISIVGAFAKGISGLIGAFNILKGTKALGAILSLAPGVKAAFAGMAAGAYGFGTALNMALGPIGWIILALTALTAAAKHFVKDWDMLWGGLQQSFVADWERTVISFKGLWAMITLTFWHGVNDTLKAVEPITHLLPKQWQQSFQEMRDAVDQNMGEAVRRLDGHVRDYERAMARVELGAQRVKMAFMDLDFEPPEGKFQDEWMKRYLPENTATDELQRLMDEVRRQAEEFELPPIDLGDFASGIGGVTGAVDLLALRLERLQTQWRTYAITNEQAAGSTTFLNAHLANLNEQLSLVTHQVDEMSLRYRDVVAATGEYSAEALQLGVQLDGLIEKQAQLTAEIKRTEEEKRRAAGSPVMHDLAVLGKQWAAEGNLAGVDWVADMMAQQMGLQRIPGLALGGTVRSPGTVLVGERGPELLHLPRGATVEPLGSRGGGDTINVTVNVHGVDDPERITRIVAENIRRGKLAM